MHETKGKTARGARKGRPSYLGYQYDEAVAKSLCFKCGVSATCQQSDTERTKGLMFKPIVFCSRFKEGGKHGKVDA